jgi:hypothetical protein
MQFRVKVQRSLEASQRLPPSRAHLRAFEAEDGSIKHANKLVRRNAAGLCADLLELERQVVLRSNLEDSAPYRRALSADGADAQLEGLLPQHHFAQGKLSRVEATWQAVDALWTRLSPAVLRAADAEHERVTVALARGAASLRAVVAPPSAQVEQILADSQRRARKSHPLAGSIRRVGVPSTAEADAGQWDEDAFDDSELFRTMLREISSAGASQLSSLAAADAQASSR